jgi:Zn-dependent protease with chaperone function
MNFFERQDQARRRTRWLLLMFALAVAGIVAAVNAVFLIAAFGFQSGALLDDPGLLGWLLRAVLIVSTVTLALIGLSSLIKVARLRSGGGVVARALGGTPVPEDTRDFQLRRLRNVVEEMSIASGVAVPEIYVLEREQAINAFAAGFSPNDAAVAVTRGALDQLTRDELQGVIAHEYSHILNGDMRLNIRLMGWLFGILVLAIIGQRLLRSGARSGGGRRGGGGQVAIVGLGLMAVGYIGVFFGHLIKAGVSRSREVLADASAVQFTRQTRGLANALRKIAGLPAGSKLASAEAEDVSHMLFAEGLGARLMSTHPPIEQRIRALDPSFRPETLKQQQQAWASQPPAGKQPDPAPAAAAFAAVPATVVLSASEVVARVGAPAQTQIRQATALRRSLPEPLVQAARNPDQAAALLFALVQDGGEAVRATRLAQVRNGWGVETAQHVEALAPQVAELQPLQRMPLALLALPAVKHRPPEALRQLRDTIHELIHADGRVSVFEYALGTMLESQINDTLRPSAAADGRLKLEDVRDDIALLLAVFAHVGHADAREAARAFQRGLNAALPRVTMPYVAPTDWPQRLDQALLRLDRLLPMARQVLLEAVVAAILHDGQVTVDEYELLRTVCASLHCPLPPLG